jgi:hypothetical protein
VLRDGRVLVAGGIDHSGHTLASVKIWNPLKNTWEQGEPLRTPVHSHAAALLKNGDVLIAGGLALGQQPLTHAMLWEQASANWQYAGQVQPTPTAAAAFFATSLLPLASEGALLFTPTAISGWSHKTPEFSEMPSMSARTRQAITALGDGRMLISGGVFQYEFGGFLDDAYVHDPITQSFKPTARMSLARHSHRSLLLSDGRVVVAGGWARDLRNPEVPIQHHPEIWHPTQNRWQALSSIRFEWQDWVHMTPLEDGSVMFLAVRELYDETPLNAVGFRAWVWNPLSNRVDEKKVPLTPRSRSAIAISPNGQVLVAGGNERTLNPDEKCPDKSTPKKVHGICKDGPAQWVEKPSQITQIWNSRDNTISNGQPLSDTSLTDPRTLVLKNGDIVVANHEPFHYYLDGIGHENVRQQRPLRWHAQTGLWSTLPTLPLYGTPSLQELPSGALVSEHFYLAPGATAWRATRRVQADVTPPSLTASGALFSLSIKAPYLAQFDESSAQWAIVHSKSTTPIWHSKPALA